MNLTRRFSACLTAGVFLLGAGFVFSVAPAMADSESGGFCFYDDESGGALSSGGETESGSVGGSESGTETGGPTMTGNETESGATSAGGDSESGGEVSVGAENESNFGSPAIYVRDYHWEKPDKLNK